MINVAVGEVVKAKGVNRTLLTFVPTISEEISPLPSNKRGRRNEGAPGVCTTVFILYFQQLEFLHTPKKTKDLKKKNRYNGIVSQGLDFSYTTIWVN